jgi:hypothetical protein
VFLPLELVHLTSLNSEFCLLCTVEQLFSAWNIAYCVKVRKLYPHGELGDLGAHLAGFPYLGDFSLPAYCSCLKTAVLYVLFHLFCIFYDRKTDLPSGNFIQFLCVCVKATESEEGISNIVVRLQFTSSNCFSINSKNA